MQQKMEPVHFSSFFTPRDIICHTANTTRDEVIKEILKKMAYNKGIGDVDQVFSSIIEREKDYCTMIIDGFAMPHARLTHISEITVGIATSEQGISFCEGDERVAHIIILILTPRDQPSLYLQVLSSLSNVLTDEAIIKKVARLQSADDIWQFFNRENMNLPDYICAGDIMTPRLISLKENDTLKHAIDLFISKNLNDVPVVDKDGDLVGVVTSYELLRVCLPDYILWMDDLSPIINFEPFSHILQNEGNTWLAEIMSHEYAVVSEDAPAIQVAQEITKRNTRQAYVLRGKTLVGVITLQQFLNKVFRE